MIFSTIPYRKSYTFYVILYVFHMWVISDNMWIAVHFIRAFHFYIMPWNCTPMWYHVNNFSSPVEDKQKNIFNMHMWKKCIKHNMRSLKTIWLFIHKGDISVNDVNIWPKRRFGDK